MIMSANRFGRAAAAVPVLLVLALATACSSSASPSGASGNKPEKANLVVGAVPAESNGALYIAQERGFFAAHGLHVKIETITSTADIVPDMLHGSIDVAAGQVPGFISAQVAGVGSFRVLANGFSLGPGVNELVALKSSGLTSAGQLAGKKIAVNALEGNGPLLTDAALAKYGIAPSRVTLVALPFPAMAAALAAHRVNAAYMTEPYVTEAEQQDGAAVLADLDQGTTKNILITAYTVTTAWAQKYPRTAAAFTAAIVEASKIADTNRAALNHALVLNLHISAQIASAMALGTYPTAVSQAQLQQVANLMLRFGELKKEFDATVLTKS
jgi:NitT/TauT family transport system substrate-binding protein